jgi:hypothetical protein
MKNAVIARFSRESRGNLLLFSPMTTQSSYQIHTESRGPHWISWISRNPDGKPERSIVLVAASQAEAEERARRWAEQQS